MIDAGAGVREAYEQLRHHVLAALPGSGHFGLTVLLREGVAAWIERCAAGAPFRSLTPPSQTSLPIVTPPLRTGIVQILVSIALSRTQEMH